MERGRLVGEAVRDGRERRALVPREREQGAVRPLGERLVVGPGEVELRAVAGREDDRLAPLAVPLGELARKGARGGQVDRDPLAELDRGAVVRDAGERELHDAKWVTGRTTATSAKPSSTAQA